MLSQINWRQQLGLGGFALIATVSLLLVEDSLTYWLQTRYMLWMLWWEPNPAIYQQAYQTLLYTFLVQVIFIWSLLNANRLVRFVYWALYAMITLIQFGYFNAYYRYMSTADVWTAFLSPDTMVTRAATAYFNWYAVVPIACVAVLIFLGRPRLPLPVTLCSPTVAIIVIVILRATVPYDNNLGTSFIKFIQMTAQLPLSRMSEGVREDLKFQAETTPTNNIVFVIDESVRGDHLSLNGYTRPTTPYLDSLAQQGVLHNWGLAISGATCSVESNRLLVTGVPPQKTSQFAQWPTVYQYAHAMNYRTYYFDTQTDLLWTGLTVKDLTYVDEHFTKQTLHEDMTVDFRVAERVWQITQGSVGNFIVINKHGTHTPYHHAYPLEETIWEPVPPPQITLMEYRKFQPETVNMYDNAIRYNSENFFRRLIPKPKDLNSTIIVYTSDHSQTLQENNELWSHCNRGKNETVVPLFIIGQLPGAVDFSYQASHSNIMPTLLDLMQVPATARLHDYEPSLLTAKAVHNKPRYYLSGELELILYDGP